MTTKCQVLAAQEAAYDSYPDEASGDFMRFEALGWSMALELAPSCDDLRCGACQADPPFEVVGRLVYDAATDQQEAL